MENIAVVGLGWLGLPLGLHLKNKGYRVCGTTTRPEKIPVLSEQGFAVELLNLNEGVDPVKMRAFFAPVSACVINLPPGKSIFQSYASQCLTLLSLFPVSTRFVFISSTSVYADFVETAYEDTRVLTHYNFTSQLFQAEKSLKSELGERLTILRLAGLVGKGRNPAAFLAGKTGLKNPGSPVNLVHQEDCIAFISEILEKNIRGECFNVCASEHPSRKEFYTRMCRQSGLEIPQFEKSSEDFPTKKVSNEKGKARLNFSYRYDSPFDF